MRHLTVLIVQLTLIAAKLSGILVWSWEWVFVPAYLFLLCALVVGLAMYAVLHEDRIRRFVKKEKPKESWRPIPALIKDDCMYQAGNHMIHIADYGHDGYQVWLKHRHGGYWQTEAHFVLPTKEGSKP